MCARRHLPSAIRHHKLHPRRKLAPYIKLGFIRFLKQSIRRKFLKQKKRKRFDWQSQIRVAASSSFHGGSDLSTRSIKVSLTSSGCSLLCFRPRGNLPYIDGFFQISSFLQRRSNRSSLKVVYVCLPWC